MKKRMWIRMVMLAVLAAFLSACNRGVGCPSDFSAQVGELLPSLPF